MNRADDKFCGGCAKALRPSMVARVIKPAIAENYDSTTPIDIRDVLSDEAATK